MPVRHNFVNPIADDPGFAGTKPSHWNDDHDLSGLVAADIVDFDTAVLAVVSGTATPGGPDGSFQFNNGGLFDGVAVFRYGMNGALTGVILGSPGNQLPFMSSNGDAGNTNGVDFVLQSGRPFDDSNPANGGGFNLNAQDGINGGTGGNFGLDAGGSDSGNAGAFTMNAGYSESGQGGNFDINAGGTDTGTPGDININGYTPDTSGDGSNINITIGLGNGGGSDGNMVINNLPSSDPGIPGALYQIAGAVMVSL